MKTIEPDQFKLSEEEKKKLVVGAQHFLAPTEDPEDEEKLHPVDGEEEATTS